MNREPWQVYCHLALSISVPLAAFLTVSVRILFCQLSFLTVLIKILVEDI